MKFRAYEKSILAAIPLGLGMSIWYLVALHAAGFAAVALGPLMLSPPIAVIIGIALIVSAVVSGASYVGRAIDALKKPFSEMNHENKATLTGVGLSVIIGFMLLAAGITIPFLTVIPVLPQLIFFIGVVGTIAGLCARIGRVADRKLAKDPGSELLRVKTIDVASKISSVQFKPLSVPSITNQGDCIKMGKTALSETCLISNIR